MKNIWHIHVREIIPNSLATPKKDILLFWIQPVEGAPQHNQDSHWSGAPLGQHSASRRHQGESGITD